MFNIIIQQVCAIPIYGLGVLNLYPFSIYGIYPVIYVGCNSELFEEDDLFQQ